MKYTCELLKLNLKLEYFTQILRHIFVCEGSLDHNKERFEASDDCYWVLPKSSENLNHLFSLSFIWYLQSDLLWSSKLQSTICEDIIVQMMQDCVIDSKEGICTYRQKKMMVGEKKCSDFFANIRSTFAIEWIDSVICAALEVDANKGDHLKRAHCSVWVRMERLRHTVAALALGASEKWPLPVYFQQHFCQVWFCLCECVSPHCISYSVVAPSTQAWNLSPLCQQLLWRNGIRGMRLEKIWRVQGRNREIHVEASDDKRHWVKQCCICEVKFVVYDQANIKCFVLSFSIICADI